MVVDLGSRQEREAAVNQASPKIELTPVAIDGPASLNHSHPATLLAKRALVFWPYVFIFISVSGLAYIVYTATRW